MPVLYYYVGRCKSCGYDEFIEREKYSGRFEAKLCPECQRDIIKLTLCAITKTNLQKEKNEDEAFRL